MCVSLFSQIASRTVVRVETSRYVICVSVYTIIIPAYVIKLAGLKGNACWCASIFVQDKISAQCSRQSSNRCSVDTRAKHEGAWIAGAWVTLLENLEACRRSVRRCPCYCICQATSNISYGYDVRLAID